MIRNFKRTAAILGVVAAGSAALVACGDSDNGSADTDTTATTAAEGGEGAEGTTDGLSGTSGQLVAEGASSQQNAMNYFGQKYQEAVSGASLAYNATGSGAGRTNFIGGQVMFAGSDSPLKDDQVEPAAERCGGNEAWHLPFVIGPVAIAYNLEGVDNLNLHVDTVAKIFKGEITKWDDAEIAAQNEGVDLPDTDIAVVYRSDESGTTDNFQKFLGAATDIWETEGQVFPATVGEGANGSNGVASQVTAIDGGITYVEAGFATQQGLGVANLDFGNGPAELRVRGRRPGQPGVHLRGPRHGRRHRGSLRLRRRGLLPADPHHLRDRLLRRLRRVHLRHGQGLPDRRAGQPGRGSG